jgi:hypothetical protein
MWIKGLGVCLQHEEVLKLGMSGSLYFLFGPKLQDVHYYVIVITS